MEKIKKILIKEAGGIMSPEWQVQLIPEKVDLFFGVIVSKMEEVNNPTIIASGSDLIKQIPNIHGPMIRKILHTYFRSVGKTTRYTFTFGNYEARGRVGFPYKIEWNQIPKEYTNGKEWC